MQFLSLGGTAHLEFFPQLSWHSFGNSVLKNILDILSLSSSESQIFPDFRIFFPNQASDSCKIKGPINANILRLDEILFPLEILEQGSLGKYGIILQENIIMMTPLSICATLKNACFLSLRNIFIRYLFSKPKRIPIEWVFIIIFSKIWNGNYISMKELKSPQLGHLPAAGGGLWCPRRREEPQSEPAACGILVHKPRVRWKLLQWELQVQTTVLTENPREYSSEWGLTMFLISAPRPSSTQ